MPCLNFNCSQISDFKHIVNGQEDTHLLGSFSPQRQFDALGKSQRGRLVHHRTLFDPSAAQQEVVTWRLGPRGEGRLQQGPSGREMSGRFNTEGCSPQDPGKQSEILNSSSFGLFWDTEKTPALDWHQAEQLMQEMW